MKKHLAALLALGLTVSAFTGCGSTGQTAASPTPTPTQPAAVSGTPEASSSPDSPVEKKTLTMAIWGNAEGYKIANEKFLETFPEYKDKVDFEVYLVPDGDVAKQIHLSLVSGQKVADILRLNYAALPEFASQGVFADVSKYMEPYRADNIDSIYNTVLTYEGVPYAFLIR